jgi:pilus assembly protein Flp/PilA
MLILTYRFLRPYLTSRMKNERAASLVEYALLVGLIAVVCIVGVSTLGKKASSKFNSVQSSL